MSTTLHTEGESNTSEARADWAARERDGPTRALLRRDADAFLHQSLSSPCVSTIARAEGIWIKDTAGRRFMDFHGNSVHHIGYGHPRLVAAIKDQLDSLPFSPRRFTNDVSVDLAERLGALAPEDLSRVLFTTGGSDANEVALRLARAATGRFKTLSFWDAFHGAGFGAASVGGEATFRSHVAGPLLPGAEHVAPFNCYRCAYGHPGPEHCGLACAKMVDFVLGREGDVAAVIAEPMRAVPVVPPPGYWAEVQAACHRHGALLIMDEIPTGLGKTGRMFAFDHDGITPDIVTLGKALGGGILPVAAVIAREGLNVAGDFAIGHYTHEKNPVTARAALTTLQIIEDEDLVARAAELGRHALERLHTDLEGCPIAGDIRGRGAMFGVEIVRDRDSRTPAPELAERIYYACLAAGLSFKISAGNVLTLSPPMTIERADLTRALDIVRDAVQDAAR
ncbi:4-aminobutyrate aminotransferase apoenzyme [Cribrihabitans marinus]|uniref:4-aminobutyrate aminotransferase apoenzyme n=1 Tax=Cribrihabitans marinus TaxID=1227549 RepID=A0A1H7D2H8_9RHOB|nr:aspartate aminotransferase family protein [Cribrihabitans marinus]GGH37196.1 aspartate aminotransferase family protein [Cribrihabitans marinus]SEJ95047.1 4-aminobutyrate aminotransferase apoenzyme [Cribrihabitans marinus]